jgi:hypothetical protein
MCIPSYFTTCTLLLIKLLRVLYLVVKYYWNEVIKFSILFLLSLQGLQVQVAHQALRAKRAKKEIWDQW